VHQDYTIQVDNALPKASRFVMISNVNESYRHAAIVAPSLGSEWPIILDDLRKWLQKTETEVGVWWADPSTGLDDSLKACPYTKNLFIFTDSVQLPKGQIVRAASLRGLKTKIIDDHQWAMIWDSRQPDAFLCHDVRDQKPFVETLYHELSRRMLKVWYAEYSLTVGDDLAGMIDKGLAQCRYAIIVVSKHLLENVGWGSGEMNALLNRQMSSGGKKLLLPVWLDVEKDQVVNRSVLLANIVALKSSEGMSTICDNSSVITSQEKPSSS
jgi:hypothetical protein